MDILLEFYKYTWIYRRYRFLPPPPHHPLRFVVFASLFIQSFILFVSFLNDAISSLDLSWPYVETTDRISGEWLVE
jgi:hypothetical protein